MPPDRASRLPCAMLAQSAIHRAKEQAMKKTAVTAASMLLGVFGVSAVGAAEGFYVGAAAQQSHFDSSEFDVEDIDNDDYGWKIITGFRFTPNIGLEATYADFGEANAPSVSVGGPFEARAEAFSVNGLVLFPVGPVDLFAKAGASRIDAKGNVGAVFFKDHDTIFAYGAGAQVSFGNLALRADYEKYDTDVVGDLDAIVVGLTYTFAPR
jgi:predicted porin